MAKVFALVDCNNFFVSCERAFRPELRTKPVAVLSNNDGCIVARSNEVKALGIPMGAPLFKVKDDIRRHKVTLFSGNFSLYGDFSQRVVQTLQTLSPDIEVYSVDESFLELSSLAVKDFQAWAQEACRRVGQWTGIPVSVGVAPTKTLAKAAAEYAKKTPGTQGVHSIVSDDVLSAAEAQARHQALLQWLPIGDVWGIGWRIAPKLRQLGITAASQLAAVSDDWVHQQLNILGFKTVKELQGQMQYPLEVDTEPQKSIARARLFGHTIRNYHEIEAAVATFTAQAAQKLRTQKEVAAGVAVFLRTPRRLTDQRGGSTVVTLVQPSADTGVLIAAALDGLRQIYDPEFSYQKAGIVLTGLRPYHAWQLSLLGDAPAQLDRRAGLMAAIDQLNQRSGLRLVRYASEHPQRTAWHSKRELRSPRYTTHWQELPVVKAN